MVGSAVSGFGAGCCGCSFGAIVAAFEGWFFGGGGLYTFVAVLLLCCGAFFAFHVVFAVVLGWAGRLLTAVLGPDGCRVTGSSLADKSLLVEAW